MTLYKTGSRKFHDAPAFIAYIVVTLIVNTIFVLYGDRSTDTTNKEYLTFSLITVSLAVIFSLVSFMILSFLFIPEFMLHFGCLAQPVLLITFALISSQVYFLFLAVFGSIFSFVFYFFWYRKNIKYTATVLKASTSIIIGNIISISVIITIGTILQVVELFILIYNENRKININYLLYVLFILHTFWTLANIAYFTRVYVGTIVSLTLFKNQLEEISSLTLEALKNSIFALGSICLGGFLLAVVMTLRYLVEDSQGNRRSGGNQLLNMILSIILSILEDIIRHANDWSFSYMAVHGKSYTESITGAWNVVIRGKNSILVNSLCIGPILGIFQVLFMAVYGLAIYLCIPDLQHLFDKREKILGSIATIAMTLFSLAAFSTVFDSATKSFLFTYAESPSSVDKFPEVKQALKEQESKDL